MKMEQPEIFLDFCRYFHQDIGLVFPSIEALVQEFSSSKKASELVELEAHLSRLASSGLTERELEQVWDRCGAQVDFPDQKMREFFAKMARLVLTRPL